VYSSAASASIGFSWQSQLLYIKIGRWIHPIHVLPLDSFHLVYAGQARMCGWWSLPISQLATSLHNINWLEAAARLQAGVASLGMQIHAHGLSIPCTIVSVAKSMWMQHSVL